MFNIWSLLRTPEGYYDYVWVNVLLIRETRKAILIEFDSRRAWLPKVWILRIKRGCHCERSETISIKIAIYLWAKKFE